MSGRLEASQAPTYAILWLKTLVQGSRRLRWQHVAREGILCGLRRF